MRYPIGGVPPLIAGADQVSVTELFPPVARTVGFCATSDA